MNILCWTSKHATTNLDLDLYLDILPLIQPLFFIQIHCVHVVKLTLLLFIKETLDKKEKSIMYV